MENVPKEVPEFAAVLKKKLYDTRTLISRKGLSRLSGLATLARLTSGCVLYDSFSVLVS